MKTVFFICALKDEHSPERIRSKYVKEYILMPILNKSFEIFSADDIAKNIITADIVRHIKESDLVICDITDLNPNVFYELGIRHMTGKPCVLLRASNFKGSIPFDIGTMNIISYPYPTPIDSEVKLTQNEILKNIDFILRIYVKNGLCENIAFSREDKKTIHILGKRIDRTVQDIMKNAYLAATEIDVLSMTGETSADVIDIFKNNLLTKASAKIRIMALSPNSELVKARFAYIRDGDAEHFFDRANYTKEKYQNLKKIISDDANHRKTINEKESSLRFKYYNDIPYFSYVRCDNVLYIALYTATEITRNSFVFCINNELNPELSNQFITQFERIWESKKSNLVLTIDTYTVQP